MPRLFRYLGLVAFFALSLTDESRAQEDREAAVMIEQLETGDWSARIHAVHELAYLQSSGLPGLAVAVQDGDWQVRMTAVHALGPMGRQAVPILQAMLKHEPCPVVRLMVLHNLGELAPEGEQESSMRWTFSASNAEVNACRDQAGPGRAAWALDKRPAIGKKTLEVIPSGHPAAAPERAVSKRTDFPAPARDRRYAELDALLSRKPAGEKETLGAPFLMRRSTASFASEVHVSISSRPRSAVAISEARRRKPRQSLPGPLVPAPPQEKAVEAPALIMEERGGKASHDPLPQLLAALKHGGGDERARAADELGQLGSRAVSAVGPLAAALNDADPRVRSSASLALGNIGVASERTVPLLVRALKDENADVGYAAALALSRIGTPKALRAFRRYVSKEARRAIETSGD